MKMQSNFHPFSPPRSRQPPKSMGVGTARPHGLYDNYENAGTSPERAVHGASTTNHEPCMESGVSSVRHERRLAAGCFVAAALSAIALATADVPPAVLSAVALAKAEAGGILPPGPTPGFQPGSQLIQPSRAGVGTARPHRLYDNFENAGTDRPCPVGRCCRAAQTSSPPRSPTRIFILHTSYFII